MLHTIDNDNFMKWLIHGIELGIDIDKYITLNCDCGCINLDNLLIESAHLNRFELFKNLIKLGANIDAKDDYGRTPFMIFTRKDNIEMMKFCVENNCDINKLDNSYNRAYHYSIGVCKKYIESINK
jgi:ankyrin repeat protein